MNKIINLIKKIPNYIWVAISAWVSRIINAGIQVISVKFLLDYLGVESYSTFILLGALLPWTLLADIGVGTSVHNYISEGGARSSSRKGAHLIRAACLLVVLLLLIFLLIFYISSPWIAEIYLKSATELSNTQKINILRITLTVFLISSLSSVSYRILYAKNLGWLANIMPTIGLLLGLSNILLFGSRDSSHDLAGTVLLFYGPSALIALGALFIFWICTRSAPQKNPYKTILVILRRGKDFWVVSIISTIVLQADFIVLSQRLNAESIVTYSVLLKFFGLASFIYAAILQAAWPSCIEYRIKQKWEELERFAKGYAFFGISFMILFTTIFLIFKESILNIISPQIKVEVISVILMGVYFSIRAWTDTYSMLLHSLNIVKPLWFFTALQALISLCLQWYFSGLYGINGILVGLILSFFLCVSFTLPLILNKIIKRKINYNK
jgi:O-antigen/teichoic acid export membrane protein